MSNKLAKRCNQ